MASKAYSGALQVALALDCTDVACEMLGIAACRVVDGSPEPVSTVWLPLKVFADTSVLSLATVRQKHFKLSEHNSTAAQQFFGSFLRFPRYLESHLKKLQCNFSALLQKNCVAAFVCCNVVLCR